MTSKESRGWFESCSLNTTTLSRRLCLLFYVFFGALILVLIGLIIFTVLYKIMMGRIGECACLIFLLFTAFCIATSFFLLYIVAIFDSFKCPKEVKKEQLKMNLTALGIGLIFFTMVVLHVFSGFFCEDAKSLEIEQYLKSTEKTNLLTSASMMTPEEQDLLFGPNDEFDEDDDDFFPDEDNSKPIVIKKYKRGS